MRVLFMKERILKFIKATWIFYPLILAAAMYFVLPYFPDFTEHVISRGLFKLVTVPLGFIAAAVFAYGACGGARSAAGCCAYCCVRYPHEAQH